MGKQRRGNALQEVRERPQRVCILRIGHCFVLGRDVCKPQNNKLFPMGLTRKTRYGREIGLYLTYFFQRLENVCLRADTPNGLSYGYYEELCLSQGENCHGFA